MRETTKNTSMLLRSTPFMLLLLLLFAFGLMIPWLGYSFDEWHFIYYSTRGSQGLAELFRYDGHSQAVWSYILSFRLLGYSPLYWHLYSLLWRWLAVLSFWLCLKNIWPEHHRQNFFVAALFAVYPIFTLQIFPISFFEIWLGYTLLFLSFYFTIRAVQDPAKRWIFMGAAIVLAVAHVFTSEYAWFVELMRPVFIWLALPSKDSLREKIVQTARIWFLTALIFISSLIWRGLFYSSLRKEFQVKGDLFAKPFTFLFGWIANIVPDMSIVLITSWYETFRAEYIYLVTPFNILLFLLMILLIVVIGFYVRKLNALSEGVDSWATQAFFLGLPSILFGILPFYVASYTLHLTKPPDNSRLVLGMLPGAALVLAAVVEKIISKPNLKIWILAMLLSLAVGWHIRYTNDYRKAWAYQSSFLQQLTWRIPGMEKNTALFVWQSSPPAISNDTARMTLNGDFPLSLAINSIYQTNPNPADSRLSYWYSDLSTNSIDVPKDTPLHAEHYTSYFDGNTSDSLLFYYDPQNNRCLHLVTAEDQYYKQYPETIKKISPYMAANRINPTALQNTKLRDEILNTKEQPWCFYYQKAELARQYGQWDQIPSLWKAATDHNLYSAFGTEYIPFIDGFARTGNWQKAKDLTTMANKLSKGMNSILCPLWVDIEKSTSASEARDATILQIRNALDCNSR